MDVRKIVECSSTVLDSRGSHQTEVKLEVFSQVDLQNAVVINWKGESRGEMLQKEDNLCSK